MIQCEIFPLLIDDVEPFLHTIKQRDILNPDSSANINIILDKNLPFKQPTSIRKKAFSFLPPGFFWRRNTLGISNLIFKLKKSVIALSLIQISKTKVLLCNFLAMQHADRCASLQLTKDQSAWKSPSVLTYCNAYFLELSLLYTEETWKHIGWIKKLHQSWDFLPYLNVHNFT